MLAEIEKWKAEGLCFKCDEKYSGQHECPRKELTVLVVLENGEEEEYTKEPVEIREEETMEIAELSMNSVVGMSSPRTLKLRERCEARRWLC